MDSGHVKVPKNMFWYTFFVGYKQENIGFRKKQ